MYWTFSTTCSCGNGSTASVARMASGLSRCWKPATSSASTRVPAPNRPTNQNTVSRIAARNAIPFTGCMAQKPSRTPKGAPFGWSMA